MGFPGEWPGSYHPRVVLRMDSVSPSCRGSCHFIGSLTHAFYERTFRKMKKSAYFDLFCISACLLSAPLLFARELKNTGPKSNCDYPPSDVSSCSSAAYVELTVPRLRNDMRQEYSRTRSLNP